MSPRRETIKILLEHGFIKDREGKKHTVYWNPKTKQMIPVKRHDFDEDDMRYVLKEAGIKLK